MALTDELRRVGDGLTARLGEIDRELEEARMHNESARAKIKFLQLSLTEFKKDIGNAT